MILVCLKIFFRFKEWIEKCGDTSYFCFNKKLLNKKLSLQNEAILKQRNQELLLLSTSWIKTSNLDEHLKDTLTINKNV